MKSTTFWSSLPARLVGVLVLVGLSMATHAQGESEQPVEAYREIPTPAAFQVVISELDGPVFADARGMTLYKWPQHKLRNGYSGEAPGKPACYREVLTVTAGLMSPYPPGIKLPDLDSRQSCAELWPPVLADEDALPVGKWSIVNRNDGSKQWAFDEQPLYTSVRDRKAGDVLGGTTRKYGGDSPAIRVPVGPPSMVPPGFAVKSTPRGRLLTTDKNASVYAFEDDSATQTRCTAQCLERWDPIMAPALARQQGQWSVLERSPGVRQWVFRQQPLYTHRLDQRSWSQEGSDVSGWQNVYLQRAPAIPEPFQVQETLAGEVLADARGMTIYVYVCGEDSADQLACDHPDDTQVYRLAMCGGGDPKKCQSHWPYVPATEEYQATGATWSVMRIDPDTGRRLQGEQRGGTLVWAYRDRPIYTFSGDKQPGDVNGSGTGEWRGQRNGLLAFWLRDDYMEGTL